MRTFRELESGAFEELTRVKGELMAVFERGKVVFDVSKQLSMINHGAQGETRTLTGCPTGS